ncbi:ABC transporter substrate-binding protein [Methanococcus maripaludis]|uniref:Putative iron compound ABC transporter periplasmic binding protein n=1 Tax=Methanococcus maripaludis OS7 TaxID=637915 RepID=A0A2Z5PS91_METMI|nr:ABC transporter substrate-binding protein [Methanococcus maripaludis]BAP62607.1 putative iron compound ABC transporter periplasmic binding protein [Methanococcus maripaludis OS7]
MKKIMALLTLAMIAFMPSACAQAIGDVNGDGSISIADVVYLFKHRNVGLDVGDLNCDNAVNVVDVVYLFKNYDTFRDPVVFAENFEMDPHWDEGYCYLVDSADNKFVLLKEGATDPEIEGATVLNVPLTNVGTVFYCPIISTADLLDNAAVYDSLKVIPTSYVKYSSELQTRYDAGEILNIGSSSTMNYDNVVASNPDIVFLADWEKHDVMEEQLTANNILSCRCFTYDEPTFMGRTEWAKFAAALWGDENSEVIDEYFQETWQKRNELLRTASTADDYPTVVSFSWSSSKDTACVYGAQHYYSRMVNEFGGEYVFNDIPGTSSNYPDKETFYERAQNADVCIMKVYTGDEVLTAEDLLSINPDFANFESFKNGRFYTSHRDYFIQEAIDPIGYMDDYARMINPELFSNGDSDLLHHTKIEPIAG